MTVRQQFDYLNYPLDRQELWLRMQQPSFEDSRIVLVPDLDAYETTALDQPFGFNTKMETGSWKIRNTFFSYMKLEYDNNFGLGGKKKHEGVPELAFNLILQRKIFDGFIINLILLGVIFILLFATLLMITTDEARNARFGMSTSSVVGLCSGLFFVIIVAHVQVRDQLAGSPIVYLEHFYLLAYMSTLAVALNAYLAHTEEWSNLWLIRYRDNLIPKLLFWLITLGVIVIITMHLGMLPDL